MLMAVMASDLLKTAQKIGERVCRLRHDRRGNIALTFAIMLVPLTLAVGAGLDFQRAYSVRSRMQADLDAALLAAVRDVEVQSEQDIKNKIRNWFNGNTTLAAGTFTLDDSEIKVDITGAKVSATVKTATPATLMRIAGYDTLPVEAFSEATVSASSYINIYIVLDKSASMLLAADVASQNKMTGSRLGCVFACHWSNITVRNRGRKNTYTSYEYARILGATLRTDVQLQAVEKVLDMVKSANTPTSHVKVGFYTLGTNTLGNSLLNTSYDTAEGIHTVLEPTYSDTTLSNTLYGNSELSSDNAYMSTDFRALKDLAPIIGDNGSGNSESDPLKLVMLITDGAQSSLGWITDSTYYGYITPPNPTWCSAIKDDKKATMAVLYTQYLPTNEQHYTKTLGKTMEQSRWQTTWGGALDTADRNTARRDYLAKALNGCASDDQYFISANNQSEIVNGFQDLLTTYMSAVRLTQ